MREVIGVDIVPELVEEGRKRAPANVELVEADATALPYGRGSFDLVCTARTLHHVPRPELALAEMNRLLRPGGTMLVADQLAPVDSLAAIELAAGLRRCPRVDFPKGRLSSDPKWTESRMHELMDAAFEGVRDLPGVSTADEVIVRSSTALAQLMADAVLQTIAVYLARHDSR